MTYGSVPISALDFVRVSHLEILDKKNKMCYNGRVEDSHIGFTANVGIRSQSGDTRRAQGMAQKELI